jgi:sphingolipid delta-4 desaturase
MSWTKLFFRFLFDNKITLYSRVLREEKAKERILETDKQPVKYY